MFNTVQTATVNNPLGPAEGHCVFVYFTVNLYNEHMIGTCLYTHDQCGRSIQILYFSLSQKPQYTQFNILDKYYHTLYQVITLWEPASQHFLL